MFDNAFRDFWGNNELERHDAFRTDVIDQGDSYLLQAELPGFQKEDINIDLKNDLLTISASHKEEKDEEDKNKYIRRERYSGTCSRSFYVGEDVKQEDIKAKFENGTLKLSIPKKEAIPEKKETKYIAIEG